MTANKKSRHFTVVARREFPVSAEDTFSAWTNPEIRRNVLTHGRYESGVKEIDISEGGLERYEDRWKNRLYGATTRRYVIIQPSKLIVAQAESRTKGVSSDQRLATQELLLFKPKGASCEIVASVQCVSVEPLFVHASEEGLNKIFDVFSQML